MVGKTLALAAFVALVPAPALACQSWQTNCDQGSDSWHGGGQQDQDRYGGGYRPSQPYASPGTPLLSDPVTEPWRQPGAGDSLLSNPQQRRAPSRQGRSLLYDGN